MELYGDDVRGIFLARMGDEPLLRRVTFEELVEGKGYIQLGGKIIIQCRASRKI